MNSSQVTEAVDFSLKCLILFWGLQLKKRWAPLISDPSPVVSVMYSMDLFGDAADIWITLFQIVLKSHYGMLRAQIHTNLPHEHPKIGIYSNLIRSQWPPYRRKGPLYTKDPNTITMMILRGRFNVISVLLSPECQLYIISIIICFLKRGGS